MSTVGLSVSNTDFDAAQALLDLQSNFRGMKPDKYGEKPLSDGKESVETANISLSCFFAKPLNKALTTPKVETVSPMYAVKKNMRYRSEAPTAMQIQKRKSPDQELPQDSRVNTYHSEETSNKRSRIFKRKPIRHFTFTSGPMPDIVANKIRKSAKKVNVSHNTGTKVNTQRDVETQTEDKYQLPIIETMEFTISKLCEKIKSLEEHIKSNSQLMETVDHDISDDDHNFEDNDDDYFKVNSNDMTMDDSNSDKDKIFTDRKTPEKVKSKHKVDQYYGYKSTKVLSNRSINANADDMVSIGDGNATIPTRIFRHVNWNSYTSATRKLLTTVFSRRVLATHSLTGKQSPAFPNKPAKKKLNPALVNDIVQTVVERCCVPENVVRTSITTKCADESKMFRTRQQNKNKRKHKDNRENIRPDSDSDD